jgi:hypothetical protein
VPKSVTLTALWVVFAVASVSVGFAAASVVGDPFTDAGTTSEAAGLAGPGNQPVTGPTPTRTADPTSTASDTATPSKSPSAASTGSTQGSGGSATVKRGITTRGGYVSATCRGGLVSVGAAPAVWWQVESLTPGRVQTARVRLQPSHDANGERVEVTASCRGGIPTFIPEYSDGGGGGGGSGGSGGGGDDSSGHGGSGDSSGSGSG